MVQQRDPWEVPAISPKQSKATSEAIISGADAQYASREAKAKAELAEYQAATAAAGLPEKQKAAALNLSPGQKKADETYAADYNSWIVNGEYANVVQDLKTLNAVIGKLRSGKTLSGNVVGRLPEFVQKALYGDDPKAVKDAIDQLTVSSLRTILGAQFTEKEGARIQAQSYDITSGEESNVARIQKSIDELLGRAMAKQAAAQYFSENGTLAGYTGEDPLALGAWDDTKIERAKKDFGLVFGEENAKSPYEVIDELKPVTETRAGASDTYVSAEAKRLASSMGKAWREGASVEDMIAMNPGIDRKALEEAEKYRSLPEPVYAKFAPYESERPASLIGSAADNAVLGPAMAFLANSTPGGSIEQIARLTGGDPEKTAFAQDYLRGKYPISSATGEFGGELVRSLVGAKALTSAGMSALPAAFASETGLGAIEGGLKAPEGETLAGMIEGGTKRAAIAAVPFAASRVLNPKTSDAVLDMRDRGVRMTTGQTVGLPNAEANISKILPVGGDITLAGQRRAFDDFQRAYLDDAASRIGTPPLDKALKPTERFGQTQAAFNDAYEIAKSNLRIVRDPEFDAAVASFRARLKNGVDFDPANAKRLEKLLDDAVVRRVSGNPSGDTYKSLDSLLGKRRAAFGKAQNDELVSGVSEMQDIIRANAVRNSDPIAVKALDDVDEGYSYLIRAEQAAKASSTPPGEFSPQQLLNAVQRGDMSARGRAFARGEARGQEFAERGVEALGKSATDVAPLERGVGLFAGPTILSPANLALGVSNAPGVRPVLNTLIAGRRPQALKSMGELVAKYPALISGGMNAIGEGVDVLQERPADIDALLERYNYTPQTGGEGIPQVGPELTEAQRNYALQSAAREPAAAPVAETVEPDTNGLGVAIGEDGPTVTLGEAAQVQPKGTLTDPNTGRKIEQRGDGRYYFKGTNEPAYPDLDPLLDRSDPARGRYRGGAVQAPIALKNGGQPKSEGYDYGNAARTFGQGLTFGFGDETEAYLRTLLEEDPKAYASMLARIRAGQQGYADANPLTARGLEMAGMVGGAMLTPSLAALRVPGAISRVAARAPRLSKLGVGLVEDGLQGAAYSAGKAEPDPRKPETSRMQAVRNDTPQNALTYMEMSALGKLGKQGLKRAVSTKPGYQAALAVRNFAQNPFAILRGR
jgi:hypothetical protein